MGYEDQYKQAILNMTHNQGWEYYVINIHHFKRTRWVFKLCEGKKKKNYVLYAPFYLRAASCFETNHSPEGFQELIATCHANQEGLLSQ